MSWPSEPGRAPVPPRREPRQAPRLAEEAVLGALLIDSDAIIRVSTVLKAEDFYREKNGWIFRAALALHERHEPIDFLTVCDELERKGQLDEVGGPAFLTGLINVVPTSIHIEHYATIVQRAAIRRRLIEAAGQIAALAYKEEDDVDEVVDRAEQVVFAVSSARLSRSVVPLRSAVSDYYDRVEYLNKHKGQMIGLPTGFARLDEILGGMQRSDMLVLAARPSMGKTSLALNIAYNVALKEELGVASFSLEMSKQQLVMRMLGSSAQFNLHNLRRGKLRAEDWPRLTSAVSMFAEVPLFIDDGAALSPTEVRARARRLMREYGELGLIVVDYLQLMQVPGNMENRATEISEISRSLKALAKELKIPVVALSQLKRPTDVREGARRPMLSDLRESGAIEQDADIVIPAAPDVASLKNLLRFIQLIFLI